MPSFVEVVQMLDKILGNKEKKIMLQTFEKMRRIVGRM